MIKIKVQFQQLGQLRSEDAYGLTTFRNKAQESSSIFKQFMNGSITNDQINNILMNLKYNRLDMKNKAAEANHTMKLRKRPPSSRIQQASRPSKGKPKDQKVQRCFGTDLTNRALLSQMQLEPMLNQTTLLADDIEPYFSSIIAHIDAVDDTFLDRVKVQLSQADPSLFTVTPEMRRVLLRWLLQVGKKFQVLPETMHICVQLVDFVLLFEPQRIHKGNFQLLGISALFVASKYNEIHTYQADKYIFVCDGLYGTNELFDMEGVILLTTKFNLQFPTVYQFIGPEVQQLSFQTVQNVKLLSNLALYDFSLFNRYKKKHLAAVIVYLALKLHDPERVRSRDVMRQAEMPEETFKECSNLLLNLYRQRNNYHSK